MATARQRFCSSECFTLFMVLFLTFCLVCLRREGGGGGRRGGGGGRCLFFFLPSVCRFFLHEFQHRPSLSPFFCFASSSSFFSFYFFLFCLSVRLSICLSVCLSVCLSLMNTTPQRTRTGRLVTVIRVQNCVA